MKKKIVGLVAILALVTTGYAFAHDSGGMMGGRGGGMMGGMKGPGMMGGQGGGMGGMMGMMRMMNECGRMMETSPVSYEPVTKERAEAIVKQRLASLKNPNLKVGKVAEETAGFVVEITTKEGSLVDKIIVDKRTGRSRSVY